MTEVTDIEEGADCQLGVSSYPRALAVGVALEATHVTPSPFTRHQHAARLASFAVCGQELGGGGKIAPYTTFTYPFSLCISAYLSSTRLALFQCGGGRGRG